MQGKMSQYVFSWVSVFVLMLMVPKHVWAGQPETAVSCAGVSEPIALNYGNHTVGCVVDPATDSDVFTFSGNRSETIRIALHTETGCFEPRLEVLDPSGTRLLNKTCTGRGGPSNQCYRCSISQSLVLPSTGTYTAVISAWSSNQVGDYTLHVERIPPVLEAPKTPVDVQIDDEINPGPDVDVLSFSGTAGSQIRLSVLSGTPCFEPRSEVYDPSGTRVLDNTCTGRGGPSNQCYLCSIVQTLTLPLSGNYTILLPAYSSGQIGSYSVSLQCLLGNCSSAGTPSPLPSTAALESPADGQVVSGISLLRGWAFGPSANPVSNIKLFVDGKETDDIPFPSKRGDVAAAYPNEPNALRSGFGTIVNYGNLSQGPHTIEVRVIARDGTSRSLVRNVVALRFAGFEFVDGNLSSVTTRNEGNEVIIQGVQIRDTQSGQTRTVTVRLQFDKASQGFVVTDIR